MYLGDAPIRGYCVAEPHPYLNWRDPPEWNRTEVLEFPGSVDGPWGA